MMKNDVTRSALSWENVYASASISAVELVSNSVTKSTFTTYVG